jgi:pilus assembly protein Flp/PilA
MRWAGLTTQRRGTMLLLMRNWLRSWIRGEKAQTLTEYALILVLIAIVAIAMVTGLGKKIAEIFQSITNELHS